VLFQKKPWNNLKKYYVEVAKDGSFQPFFHIMESKGREDIALNKKDPHFKCVTIAEAIEIVKRLNGKTTLTVMPEFMDKETYEWFTQNCPRELWQFYAMSKFRPFN